MYHVDVTNNGGYTFQIASKGGKCIVDMKGEQGVTPSDALLASLGSCIGVYLRKYAEGSSLDIRQFSIKVDAEFSKEAPICFKKINVSVDLNGFKFDERRLKGMIEFIKKCPVHATFKNNPEVEIKVN
jgi:uncharacterized OsmC-like protein